MLPMLKSVETSSNMDPEIEDNFSSLLNVTLTTCNSLREIMQYRAMTRQRTTGGISSFLSTVFWYMVGEKGVM